MSAHRSFTSDELDLSCEIFESAKVNEITEIITGFVIEK